MSKCRQPADKIVDVSSLPAFHPSHSLAMFPTARILRSLSNVSLKNRISTTALKCEKSEPTKPEKDVTEGKKQHSGKQDRLKTLYREFPSDEEKNEAKKKLKSLLEEMKHEAPPSTLGKDEKNVKVTQALVRKKKEKVLKNTNLSGTAHKYVEAVAQEFGGDVKKTARELFESLKTFTVKKEAEEDVMNFGRVDRELPPTKVKKFFGSQSKFNLNSYLKKDLGIFDVEELNKTKDSQIKLKIWDELEALHLKSLVTSAPRNHFEEQIQWTERGKMWHFPIDNDQGREKEAAVDFTEHIFLDEYLDDWCPKRGPVRKFMDLVLVGLSKNYHLTVEEKIEHIYWYRDYFENKKKLLEELGALGAKKEIGRTESPAEKDLVE